MNTISKLLKSIFNPQHQMLTPSDSSVQKEVASEPLPLDIYQDLPFVGEDRPAIMALIKEAFPDNHPDGWPYPHVRHNRRELYKSIHFLRTKSQRKWVYDVGVARGEYTEDKLAKDVAPTQQGRLRAV
jgi:hypothetical protein